MKRTVMIVFLGLTLGACNIDVTDPGLASISHTVAQIIKGIPECL